jgi:hypothetical protein
MFPLSAVILLFLFVSSFQRAGLRANSAALPDPVRGRRNTVKHGGIVIDPLSLLALGGTHRRKQRHEMVLLEPPKSSASCIRKWMFRGTIGYFNDVSALQVEKAGKPELPDYVMCRTLRLRW